MSGPLASRARARAAGAAAGARAGRAHASWCTRAASAQAQRFVRQLLEPAGARREAPVIVIGAPPSWAPLDAALDALGELRLGHLHAASTAWPWWTAA